MAKAVKTPKKEKVNSAYTRSAAPEQAAKDNESKIAPTMEAGMSEGIDMDPTDAAVKLLTDGLKDLYWAENHLSMVLPRMARAASLDTLKTAINNHTKETKEQSKRLEDAFELLGLTPKPKKCDAVEGLSMEGEKIIETTAPGSQVRNLGILMSSQKVEHYEMAAYTGLIALARSLGYDNIAETLTPSLEEEQASSQKLEDIYSGQLSELEA